VRVDKLLAAGSAINLIFAIVDPLAGKTYQQPVTLTVSNLSFYIK
jgi:hypothetical protein